MALGGGKYDAELTAAVAAAKLKSPSLVGGTLILIGKPGEMGFSCQLPLNALVRLPMLLRIMADQIEADLQKGQL